MKRFLVGYMASGKSRYGRTLAAAEGVRFFDLDRYIEEREHRTINEIFRDSGEAHFRKLESRYLHELCELYEDFILSCGGGAPCFNDNMEYMNSQGITIFLNPSIDTIVARLIRGKWKRPLVAKLSDQELREYVEKHLAERLPYYNMAKEQVKNEDEN
ncbi:MAG: shikimate kinase [Odoribacter sp.]|nr:shikimate kinase [Odoribacter sp.]